ncbi:gephyrin-like molybdotransferase receptor GlpR [Streptomyces sp. NPDC006992]|uniref:gephyrin-like molybdotransferase receptor GlpR n=1 Tax=Streptomyces sp. NPDC006992 TaxID=3155601 RepID=UPI0033DE65AC
MSSSGLIYAVIVGAWAAYLVPMWLRRQDELNEARPTERFSTAIRLLSGKAGMERRYAREAERRRVREGWAADDPYARRGGAEHEPGPSAAHGSDGDAYRSDPDAATEQAVDVRAFADPKTMVGAPGTDTPTEVHAHRAEGRPAGTARPGRLSGGPGTAAHGGHEAPEHGAGGAGPGTGPARAQGRPSEHPGEPRRDQEGPDGAGPDRSRTSAAGRAGPAHPQTAASRTAQGAGRRAKQAKRAKLLARRRRTTMLLFLAFTVGTVVAAVRGLALLWVPAVPAVLLSVYIVHLRVQERRRFAFTMDRRRAEAAARSLRAQRPYDDAGPSDRRRAEALHTDTEPGLPVRTEGTGGPGREERRRGGDQHPREERRSRAGSPPETAAPRHGHEHSSAHPEASAADRADAHPEALTRAEQQEAAERRALVEQTDHAEWVDQQRARDRDSSEGEGWEPVPVPLPTYVSAPVAPRATRGVDLEAPDAWSSARSSSVPAAEPRPVAEDGSTADRDRTPLFDQYEGEQRPRAANE